MKKKKNYDERLKSGFQRKKKRYEDDDISFLSYSTPVISNTTSRKHNSRSRKGDEHSDVTPIISNREDEIRRKIAAAAAIADGGVAIADSNDSESAVSAPKHLKLNAGDSVVENENEDEDMNENDTNNSNDDSRDRDDVSNVGSYLEDRQFRNTLFKIKSGHIPTELQSMHSSRSSRNDRSFRSRSSAYTSENENENENSDNNMNENSRNRQQTFNRFGPRDRSYDRSSSASMNNQIRSLRNELDMNHDSKCKTLLTAFRENFQNFVPFISCTLFMVQLLLSSYSSLSCRFLTCNIGFNPFNVNIQQNELDVGFWSFYSKSEDGSMKCLRYPQDFGAMFIAGDSAWEASRSIGIINISISSFAFIILTFVVGNKTQHYFIQDSSSNSSFVKLLERRWKDCCLFCAVLMFVLEVVKLVFMNIEICSKDKWMNVKGDMVAGQGCTLSIGGIWTIVTLVFGIATIVMLGFSERLDCKRSEDTLDDMLPLNHSHDFDYDVETSRRLILSRQRSEKEKNSDSSGSQRLNIDSTTDQPFTTADQSFRSNNNGSFRNFEGTAPRNQEQDDSFRNSNSVMQEENGSSRRHLNVISEVEQEMTTSTFSVPQSEENFGRPSLSGSASGNVNNVSYHSGSMMNSNEGSWRGSQRDKLLNANTFSTSGRVLVRNSMGFHSNVDESLSMRSSHMMESNKDPIQLGEEGNVHVYDGSRYSRSGRALVRDSMGFHSKINDSLSMQEQSYS